MRNRAYAWLTYKVIEWLVKEQQAAAFPRHHFERLRLEIKPCDVLLIGGRARVSGVIRFITQSLWTHCAIYIGRLDDICQQDIREQIAQRYPQLSDQQLLVEALLGKGIVVSPLKKYQRHHLRICRPSGLDAKDARRVITHAVGRLGESYDVRQLLDLARFLSPWTVMPRRWCSSLFKPQTEVLKRTICSSMLAEAFASVHFPVFPEVPSHSDTHSSQRNLRLLTPRDFDLSPYFEIIKYPLADVQDWCWYRRLQHNNSNVMVGSEIDYRWSSDLFSALGAANNSDASSGSSKANFIE
jgi:hypothetical protein